MRCEKGEPNRSLFCFHLGLGGLFWVQKSKSPPSTVSSGVTFGILWPYKILFPPVAMEMIFKRSETSTGTFGGHCRGVDWCKPRFRMDGTKCRRHVWYKTRFLFNFDVNDDHVMEVMNELGDDFRIGFRTLKIHYFDQDNRQRIKHGPLGWS